MPLPNHKSATSDQQLERVTDLAVFLFGQLFVPFSPQVLCFEAVAVRRPIYQKWLRLSSPRRKSQSLNRALISERNHFSPVQPSLLVLGMGLTMAL
jgi:hypothetical protein